MTKNRDIMTNLIISTVGNNPLTSAIILKNISQPRDIILLLCSKKSFRIAEQIREWVHNILQIEPYDETSLECYLLELPIMDIDKSKYIVQNKIYELSGKYDEIITDITGGTKTMSLIIYDLKFKYHLSNMYYLHGSTIQDLLLSSSTYVSKFLSLEEILNLHNWRQVEIGTPQFSEKESKLARKILELHYSFEGAKIWYEWKRNQFFSTTKKFPYQWKSEHELQEVQIPVPNVREMQEFTKIIIDQIDYRSNVDITSFNLVRFHNLIHTQSFQESCDWLNGKWLEVYVYNELLNISGLEVAINIETKEPKFEIDVLVTYQNQLFVFSCTTITDSVPGGKSKLKNKIFEVLIRSEQMGGSKTHSSLVSMSDDTDTLRTELSNLSINLSFHIFGRESLPNFRSIAKQWIEQNIGEYIS